MVSPKNYVMLICLTRLHVTFKNYAIAFVIMSKMHDLVFHAINSYKIFLIIYSLFFDMSFYFNNSNARVNANISSTM